VLGLSQVKVAVTLRKISGLTAAREPHDTSSMGRGCYISMVVAEVNAFQKALMSKY
jgi:hypothetical protein